VKTAAEAELHTVTLRLLPASAQHSLKNRETHAHRVMLAHRPVAPATAKCAVVVKTRVVTGRLRVAPIASHVTVQPEPRLAHLVTAIRVRLVMTVVLVVNLVHAMTVQLVLSETATIVRVVHLATAIRVRLVTTVALVVNSVLVTTAQRVRSMVTALLVVTSVHAMTARLAKTVAHAATSVTAHLAEISVQTVRPVRSVLSVMAAAQTA
jgi:hypothetical protein